MYAAHREPNEPAFPAPESLPITECMHLSVMLLLLGLDACLGPSGGTATGLPNMATAGGTAPEIHSTSWTALLQLYLLCVYLNISVHHIEDHLAYHIMSTKMTLSSSHPKSGDRERERANRAVVYAEPGTLKTEVWNLPIPTPKRGEVLVKMSVYLLIPHDSLYLIMNEN